jgi:serine/threonine protein phosphatase PrpC
MPGAAAAEVPAPLPSPTAEPVLARADPPVMESPLMARVDPPVTETPEASSPPPAPDERLTIAPRPHATAPLEPEPALGTAPLIRRPDAVPEGYTAATAPTQILPFEADQLHPLPAGALLDGRYIIKGQVQALAGRNLYKAEARDQQRCPSCGFLALRDATTCPRCEEPLTGQPPLRSYFVAESLDQDALVREPELIERGLNHPNLMPLVDLFTYTPYGPPRHYTVAEARQGVTLSQFTLPRPVDQVMEWALQLSDALRYLHAQGVISPGATPENILIKEDEAVLANLQNARPASEEPAKRDRQFANDIGLLAATLYESLTGRYSTTLPKDQRLLDAHFPPEMEEAFDRALRPTPTAPPITDEEWRQLIGRAAEIVTAPPPNIRVRSGRLSHVGMSRPLNEDCLAVIECQAVQESVSAGLGLYVVADGMGGYEGGEIASAIAIATVTERLLHDFITPQFSSTAGEPDETQITTWLSDAIQNANQHINNARSARGNDMGTTLVGAIVSGDRAYIANVGDSRAYLLRKGEKTITQVSVDHSLVQRLVATGQITAEEAKYHPYRNVIFRSLGGQPNVEIDMFHERLHPGDRLLLCSDGLSGMVPDPELASIIAAHDDPQEACRALIERANAAGGVDNITAVLVYIEEG